MLLAKDIGPLKRQDGTADDAIKLLKSAAQHASGRTQLITANSLTGLLSVLTGANNCVGGDTTAAVTDTDVLLKLATDASRWCGTWLLAYSVRKT